MRVMTPFFTWTLRIQAPPQWLLQVVVTTFSSLKDSFSALNVNLTPPAWIPITDSFF
jgi:hypothetical protein